jgi:hypothetical protein
MSQTGMTRDKNSVLVHRGTVDGSGWEGVYELLAVGVFIWLSQAWVTREDARLGKDAETPEKSRRWGREL